MTNQAMYNVLFNSKILIMIYLYQTITLKGSFALLRSTNAFVEYVKYLEVTRADISESGSIFRCGNSFCHKLRSVAGPTLPDPLGSRARLTGLPDYPALRLSALFTESLSRILPGNGLPARFRVAQVESADRDGDAEIGGQPSPGRRSPRIVVGRFRRFGAEERWPARPEAARPSSFFSNRRERTSFFGDSLTAALDPALTDNAACFSGRAIRRSS